MSNSEDLHSQGNYAEERGSSTGAAAAAAPTASNPFIPWVNKRLKDRTVMHDFAGRDLRVVEITPEQQLKLEKLDGQGFEYVPLTEAVVNDLMEQI